MKLFDALRAAHTSVDAPHPDGYVSENTFISRAALRTVLDELATLQRGAVPAEAPTLRDTFAMHAPGPDTMPDCYYALGRPSSEAHTREERECMHAIARYAYSDAMLAARGVR